MSQRQRYYKHYTNNWQTSGNPSVVISGIFQIPFKAEIESKEDSDESDEEENDPWVDFQEMDTTDSTVRSRIPKETKVHIKDNQGQIHICKGKFPLTQIFWKVTVNVYKGVLKSAPVYAIRKDLDVQKNKLIMIFLTDCLKGKLKEKIANAVAACFETFCRVTDCASTINFTNLEDILKKYIVYEKQQGCCLKQQVGIYGQYQQEDHSLHLLFAMKESELCTMMLRASSHPSLVETISSLLPYTFINFLHKLEQRGFEARELANEMADQKPWEFMFRDIIYKKLKLHGTEATLLAYKNAGYFSRTPQTEKDAIYIYEVLKTDARRDGHTYIPFKRLKNSYHLKELSYQINGEKRWKEAFQYLEVNGVIIREPFNGDMNIFLRYIWQAEVDVVGGLETVIQKHLEEPLSWAIDYKSPDFERICTDPDQLRALHLIASSPITVLSGKGGCGKTTVITTLLKHICDQVREEVTKRSNEELEQTTETDTISDSLSTFNYDSFCKDEDLSSSRNVNTYTNDLLPSETSTVTSISQNPTFTNSHCHVNREIVTPKDHDKSEEGSSILSSGSNFTENAATLKSNNVQVPSNRHFPVLDTSTSLDLSGHNPSSNFQTSKNKKLWPRLNNSENSNEERLRREVISDLLKIIKLSRSVDHPMLQDYKKRILLTAPTGKAAKLLGSKANLPSATLHSVIMSWRMYLKDNFGDEWSYSEVEALVVDECSLLSVRLFACMMNILVIHANLKKIILLGDVRQLPSIEAGNFLTDVFNAFRSVTNGEMCISLELTSNHRSESGLIVENAGKISHQIMPTFSDEKHFHLVQLSETLDENERDEAIRHLLNNAEDVRTQVDSQFISFRNAHCTAVNELCCLHYNKHSIKTASVNGRKEHTDFRIGDKICFGKNALVLNFHQLMLNRYLDLDTDLQEAVSQAMLNHKKVIHKLAGKSSSFEGSLNQTKLKAAQALSLIETSDAVFDQTINEMVKRDHQVEKLKAERAIQGMPGAVQQTKKSSLITSVLGENKEKLCNGEVFFIMDEINHFDDKLKQNVRYLVLSDKDQYSPRVVCAPLKILKKGGKMRHSWARTIHTFQGSECDSVVYVLGKAMPQNWQHVYTAVTRGKKAVYIIGSWEELHKAISRKAHPRHSRLRHRLEEMIKRYKTTLLYGFDEDRNMTKLQDAAGSGSIVYTASHNQVLKDSIEYEQVKMPVGEYSGCLNTLQGSTHPLNDDLNQEIHWSKIIQDDFNVFNSQEDFNVFNSQEDFNFSDEEFKDCNTNFTSLKGTEAQSSSAVNVSTESNIAVNMGDRINASTSLKLMAEKTPMFSPNKTALDISPKHALSLSDSEDFFTPPKVRRTEENPLNTPFRDGFRRKLMLEEELCINDSLIKNKLNN